MKRELKINVKDVFSENYVNSWPKDGTELFLFLIHKSHDHSGISSPDLFKNATGLTCAPTIKQNGVDLWIAMKNKTIILDGIYQRKGYKCYKFSY